MKSARQQIQRSHPGTLTAGTSNGLAIELHDLHKYFGATKAVDGIDLRVASGEIVAILGPNGAGKSTTIDMVLGLTTPSQGSVRIFKQTPRQALAAGAVGAMLQTGGLPQYLSVAELITMIASLYQAPMPVPEVFARTGLSDSAASEDQLRGQRQQG